jgi:hypothetical protein
VSVALWAQRDAVGLQQLRVGEGEVAVGDVFLDAMFDCRRADGGTSSPCGGRDLAPR